MYEYLVTDNRSGWQPWRECVPAWKYPKAQVHALSMHALTGLLTRSFVCRMLQELVEDRIGAILINMEFA